jgi:transposase-like protein
MDEAYIRFKGYWYDRYRAMDTSGQAIDYVLTAYRDEMAAKRFFTEAIRRHGGPEKVTIDGSEANAAALRNDNVEYGTAIVIRQVKYVNTIIEQDL